jgi:protein involved in polysaccharide export with SLBB domain
MNSRLSFMVLLSCSLLTACATSESIPAVPSEQLPGTGVSNESGTQTLNRPELNEDAYRLGEGDGIAIQVFDEPDLTLQTVVGAGGSINYSYLGDIRVAGKSPVELETQIAGLLRNGYLVNPSVNVSVTQYRPFYINGEVRSPGKYQYQPGLTLDRAIALAGGLTDRASVRKMFVTKSDGGISDEFKVPLSFRVQPGDTITIKEGFF